MSFWAQTTEFKGDGTDENGDTFINVQGVPGAEPRLFLIPVEDELKKYDGLIVPEVVRMAMHHFYNLGEHPKEVEEEFPQATRVLKWLVRCQGKRIAVHCYKYFSY